MYRMKYVWECIQNALELFKSPWIWILILGFFVEVKFNLDEVGKPSLTLSITTSKSSDYSSSDTKNATANRAHVVRDPRVVASQDWDIVIVGAGLSGAVLAERFATVMGKSVLIIERRDHIGGNCYDYLDPETGILVSKYGPHLFHTDNEKVWSYLQRFATWRRYDHQVGF